MYFFLSPICTLPLYASVEPEIFRKVRVKRTDGRSELREPWTLLAKAGRKRGVSPPEPPGYKMRPVRVLNRHYLRRARQVAHVVASRPPSQPPTRRTPLYLNLPSQDCGRREHAYVSRPALVPSAEMVGDNCCKGTVVPICPRGVRSGWTIRRSIVGWTRRSPRQ